MPQITLTSEKRSPQHTKENLTGLTSKGIEILDFRESWLNEIEMYKKQVRVQQLLTATSHNARTANGSSPTAEHRGEQRDQVQDVRKSPFAEGVKRVRQRSHSETQEHHKGYREGEHELVLKRPREDIAIANGPTNTETHTNTKTHTNSPAANGKAHRPAAANAINANINNAHKIIINNYHASSLVSAPDARPKANDNCNASRVTKVVRNAAANKVVIKNIDTENLVPATTATTVVTIEATEGKLPSSDEDVVPEPPKAKTAELVVGNGHGDSKSDDDVGSNLDDNDDDDDFGDIDNVNVFDDSSDDSDSEYVGYSFALSSDEAYEKPERNLGDSSIDITNASYTTPKSVLTPSLFPMVAPYLTFSSHAEKGPAIPPELQKVLKWKLSPVMPRIVKRVVLNSGFRLIKKTTDWMAVWEKHMKSPCFKTIRSHQKFNHIPGSFKIGRKDSVWRNLRGYMMKYGKEEFGFMQKTFILPQELDMLKKSWPKYAKKSTKWIVKPPASARGTGISVVNKWSDFPKQKPLIVQKYIEKPLLINKSKFDLRLYVIITSINPLRIYMHKEGLARFASVQYSNDSDSLTDRCMHLTNYSINKFSANYSKNEDINACQGHKWSLKSLWSYLRAQGHNTTRVWGTLRNLVIKTIIGGEGCLNRMFRQNVNSRYNCYELFGFDVLLDENLVPWLLEVNISPSLHSDLPLDMHIKGPLIQAVLNTALYQVPPKLSEKLKSKIQLEMNLTGPLCYDRRLFTTCLSPEEIKKHNYFTSSDIEFREEYIDSILDNLTPDDIRCLIISEDELARSAPLERIFPNAESHIYLKFVESPRYYNRLIDAWETKYVGRREEGIKYLQALCKLGRHLEVPAAALIEEPHVEFTDIDLLHVHLNKSPTPTPASGGIDSGNNTSVTPTECPASAKPIADFSLCSKEAHFDQRNLTNDYSTPRPVSVEYVK